MPRAKKMPRRNAWRPPIAAGEAAVVLTLKRGEVAKVYMMEGDADLLAKMLAAVSSQSTPRKRPSSRQKAAVDA